MKSSPQKIWEAINDLPNFAPKAFPQVFDSIVVLEGDGNSMGTVRKIKYAQGSPIASVTEKLDVVDDEKKTIGYTFTDGDVFKFYKSFKATVVVSPMVKGDGALMKYSGEFERVEDAIMLPDSIEEFLSFSLRTLDNHLLQQK
ncbi:MLP-like protein 423 [Dorcoceras hygrometricum]|uniref:MLP-like protein 423 n=1 Tax=Dorcoceras hygrometricum TaxID=472368 RepID=A0A2Z7AV25_9LAMI|nr:MLP-like protein 423 [Dorcoceras hygrometricum]